MRFVIPAAEVSYAVMLFVALFFGPYSFLG